METFFFFPDGSGQFRRGMDRQRSIKMLRVHFSEGKHVCVLDPDIKQERT